MVKCLIDLGFSDLYATPHQRAGMFLPDRDAIDRACSDLNAALKTNGGPSLRLGFENFWDEVFVRRVAGHAIPSYDDGPSFLFEVPTQVMPSSIEESLFDLRIQGKLPVMAHPERYVSIQNQIARAESIGRSAALVIDLAALDGAHGKVEMRTARQLVQSGLAHAAASDIHRPDDGRAIAAGIGWIQKHMGVHVLRALLIENPRQILAGEMPEPPR
jgi:protein-tyrosine phosphatase